MKSILLVEDNKNIAAALGMRLRHAGYEVTIAFDGVSGVNQATKTKPDIVVMDISMPGGSGLLVARRLRRMAPTANTPIIFITASTDPALRDEAMSLGAVDFFEKPFEAKDLLKAIQDTLEVGANGTIG